MASLVQSELQIDIKREIMDDEIPQSVMEIGDSTWKSTLPNLLNIKQEPEDNYVENMPIPVMAQDVYPSYESTYGINSIYPIQSNQPPAFNQFARSVQQTQPCVINQFPPYYGFPPNAYNPGTFQPFGWVPHQGYPTSNRMALQGMSVMPNHMPSGQQMLLNISGNTMQMPTTKQGSRDGPMCFTNPNSNFVLYISGLDQCLPTAEISASSTAPPKQTYPIVIEDKEERAKEVEKAKKVPKIKTKKKKSKKARDIPVKAVISEWGCVPCNRMFRNRGGLLQHNNTYHSGAKPHICKVCGKRYHDEATKQQHERRHDVLDKPHKCSQCPKQYLHANDLKRHFHLHHQDTRFTCRYCGKAFDRDDHVKDHEISHENGTAKRVRSDKCSDEITK